MKKMVLLMSLMAGLLVSVMSFSSCSSDSDSGSAPINVDDFVGSWLCIQSTDVVNGERFNGLMMGKYLQINENCTYTSTSSSMGYEGTWELNGNKVIVKHSSVIITATVSLSGNTLRLVGTTSQGISFDYTFTNDIA